MSASTGTIRRPMAQGPIFSAIAVGVASLLAAGALAWGALTFTANKPAAGPVPAPSHLDKGSGFEAPRHISGPRLRAS